MEIQDNEYFEHHGIKDQTWGVQNGPPYPLNAEGKKKFRERLKERRQANAEKKKRKKKAAALKKARKTKEAKKKEAAKKEKQKEQEQKRKEKILKGSPAKVYRNRKQLTRDEISDALARFEWEEKIQNYSVNRLSNASKKAESIVKILNRGIDGYNSVASVYNAWFPDNTIPVVSLPNKNNQQNQQNNQNKDDKKK